MPEGRRKQALTGYLEHVLKRPLIILPYDHEAALWYALEHARLAAQGRTPPFVDGQIAAIAMVHNLTLVTCNTNDFFDFAGLVVENWFVQGLGALYRQIEQHDRAHCELSAASALCREMGMTFYRQQAEIKLTEYR